MVYSNGALIRDDVVLCVSAPCSYPLEVNVSNTTSLMASVASINGDHGVGPRRSYTIGGCFQASPLEF